MDVVGPLLPVSAQLSDRPWLGNTRLALATTPQINGPSHILLWFDNQPQNITGEMCPKYHYRGNVSFGLVQTIAKVFCPEKMRHYWVSYFHILWFSSGWSRNAFCLASRAFFCLVK